MGVKERFYTDATTKNDLYDLLIVDANNKFYKLLVKVKDLELDGYDEFNNEIYSLYVSRYVFNAILNSVKKDFTLNEKLWKDF